MVAWLIANNLASLFQCRPIRKGWQIKASGHCIDHLPFFIGTQVPILALDVVILALPVSAVCRLQMSTLKKVSVGAIFLLGGLSIVIGIIRLVVLIGQGHDITYRTGICSWSVLEPAVEVFSACLPTLAPMLHMRPRLGTSLRSPLQWEKRSRISEPSANKRYSGTRSNKGTMFEGINHRMESNASADPFQDVEIDQIPLRPISKTYDVNERIETC